MQTIVGRWIWPCLLRRSLLSVMDAVFKFCNEADMSSSRRLPQQVRVELNILLDIFPLMYAD